MRHSLGWSSVETLAEPRRRSTPDRPPLFFLCVLLEAGCQGGRKYGLADHNCTVRSRVEIAVLTLAGRCCQASGVVVSLPRHPISSSARNAEILRETCLGGGHLAQLNGRPSPLPLSVVVFFFFSSTPPLQAPADIPARSQTP